MPLSLKFPPISSRHFAIFRIALGLYLAWHHFALLAYANDVIGPAGPIGASSRFPPFSYFPNVINTFTELWQAQLFLAAAVAVSLLFAAGVARRVSGLVLWYCWASFFNYSNLTINPSAGVVGWLLLLSCACPSGEAFAVWPKARDEWRAPTLLIPAAWIFLGVTMSVAGFQKLLHSESWQDGSVFAKLIFEYPMRRLGFFVDLAGLIPPLGLKLLAWTFLFGECSFVFLIFVSAGRRLAWHLTALMLISSAFIIDFTPIPIGVLLAHLLIKDPRWWARLRTVDSAPPVFDTVANE